MRLWPTGFCRSGIELESRDVHGVYEKFRDPVDFIVIEDLSRYRATQGRAPRENGRLMRWCHRAIRDKLRELCEPFGIPVLETPPAYSSVFCSRTGVAGFRAVEVTAGFEQHGVWRRIMERVDSDGNRRQDGKLIENLANELAFAQKMFERRWRDAGRSSAPPKRTFILPQTGGPLFVPVTDTLPGAAIQPVITHADVNAAINLGLRAISDPRLLSIHSRIRTTRLKSKGTSKRERGDEAALWAREKRKYGGKNVQLVITEVANASAARDTGNPNYFYDVAKVAEWDRAEINDPVERSCKVTVVSGKALWSIVRNCQWQRCAEINQGRVQRWECKSAEDDQIPM